jgi:hypothetical protein
MSFESSMMKRLAECGTEACHEIERGLKAGRSLGDVVLDTIETLPASKTRELRRWLEDWEAWEEWLTWKERGWRVQRKGGYVDVYAPPMLDIRDGEPSTVAIAAAIGVQDVEVQTPWHLIPGTFDYTAYFRVSWAPRRFRIKSAR